MLGTLTADFFWGNEAINREARDVEDDIIDRPWLLHSSHQMVYPDTISESGQMHSGVTRMSDQYPVDGSIIVHLRSDCGLPVGGVGPQRLDSSQVGVLKVHQQSTSLTEVSNHYMFNDLSRAVAPIEQNRVISC